MGKENKGSFESLGEYKIRGFTIKLSWIINYEMKLLTMEPINRKLTLSG